MTTLTLPRAGVPLTQSGDLVSRDWYRFLHDLAIRAGGVNGLSTIDVDAGSYAAMQPAASESICFDVLQSQACGDSIAADLSQSLASIECACDTMQPESFPDQTIWP